MQRRKASQNGKLGGDKEVNSRSFVDHQLSEWVPSAAQHKKVRHISSCKAVYA